LSRPGRNDEVRAEEALVAAGREPIALAEKKTQSTLAHVWGEEDSEASNG